MHIQSAERPRYQQSKRSRKTKDEMKEHELTSNAVACQRSVVVGHMAYEFPFVRPEQGEDLRI